ncbi:MAG: adenylate/guanylate cyclase domain-containing protein, partial [Desulfobulbaceae bacterium]|nr:adenylate/guanylate cyclase domain-containing protein [Desulfobulbaceae bacterium]
MIRAILSKLLTPSPFKTGCIIVLAAALTYYSFGTQKPHILTSLDNRIVDAMFLWRGTQKTTQSVVIVDINEKSLKELGQWPWPRDTVAKLVSNLQAGGAKVVGFDIVFAEPDRTSPKRFVDQLETLLHETIPDKTLQRIQNDPSIDHDIILGKAVSAGHTALGYVFQTTNDGLKSGFEQPFPASIIRVSPATVAYDQLALIKAYRAIINVADVSQAETEGFFNVFPDAAGTVRRVPLVMSMDGIPYTSLALEMLRMGMGTENVLLHASKQVRQNQRGLLGVSIGKKYIPTDDQGQTTVNFRGPSKTFQYISAIDIINGSQINQVRDKYVLIGTSAAGLLDLRATPFSNVFPGVEVHANVIDNALAGDQFVYDALTEIGITYLLIIFGGLFLSALLAYSSPLAGGLGGFLLIEATVIGNYQLFFLQNQIIGVTYPLLTIATIFPVVTLFNYFFEGREKRFISHAFGHYVSPQVVNKLVANPEGLGLAGEEKNLSVLFSDIRGFTTISESMTSAQLAIFMNQYLSAMSSVIMDFGGTVDKFIGDAIMAIWGAPLDDPDHAANAVRTAMGMMNSLHKKRLEWEAQGLPAIDIGIGINTGIMSVGNFGSDERFDYTVLGDAVNLGARLEGSNKEYGTNIIISEYTLKEIGDRFFCRFLDRVKVKGKLEPVTIYEPLTEGEPD